MGIFDWASSSSSSSSSPSSPTLANKSGNVAITPGPLVNSTSTSTSDKGKAKDEGAGVGNPLNPEGLKPCCACPATKSLRDSCFLAHDPDTAQVDCKEFVEKHRECMRGYGFKV